MDYNNFMKLDNITDAEFKMLERKARAKAQRYGIRFSLESAFISSSSLHGFYLPNRSDYRVIAFKRINNKIKAILLNHDLQEVR